MFERTQLLVADIKTAAILIIEPRHKETNCFLLN